MADGAVKVSGDRSSMSPVYPAASAPPRQAGVRASGTAGHSRNTSNVSIASTASSRLGEVNIIPSYCPDAILTCRGSAVVL